LKISRKSVDIGPGLWYNRIILKKGGTQTVSKRGKRKRKKTAARPSETWTIIAAIISIISSIATAAVTVINALGDRGP
jgi:hypothetical protein